MRRRRHKSHDVILDDVLREVKIYFGAAVNALADFLRQASCLMRQSFTRLPLAHLPLMTEGNDEGD